MKQLATSENSRKAIERHEARGKRFDFLRERLTRMNVKEVWEELETGLTLGDNRRNPEIIQRALDECDGSLRQAGMILQAAIEELEEYDLHFRAVYSEWDSHARTTLEMRKKEKRHSGVVTAEIVENWVARNIADYRRWKAARRDLERSRTMAKHMFAAWESRAASLRKQADMTMQRHGIDPKFLDRRRRRDGGDEDGND